MHIHPLAHGLARACVYAACTDCMCTVCAHVQQYAHKYAQDDEMRLSSFSRNDRLNRQFAVHKMLRTHTYNRRKKLFNNAWRKKKNKKNSMLLAIPLVRPCVIRYTFFDALRANDRARARTTIFVLVYIRVCIL